MEKGIIFFVGFLMISGVHWFLFTFWACFIEDLIPLNRFLVEEAFYDAWYKYEKGTTVASFFSRFLVDDKHGIVNGR